MKWHNDQIFLKYIKEYKAKYLQFDCEKNPRLDMIGAFLTRLHESFWCKLWKRENHPTTMMELLDVMIRLGNARKIGRVGRGLSKRPSEAKNTSFRNGNMKLRMKPKGIEREADHPSELRQAGETSRPEGRN